MGVGRGLVCPSAGGLEPGDGRHTPLLPGRGDGLLWSRDSRRRAISRRVQLGPRSVSCRMRLLNGLETVRLFRAFELFKDCG